MSYERQRLVYADDDNTIGDCRNDIKRQITHLGGCMNWGSRTPTPHTHSLYGTSWSDSDPCAVTNTLAGNTRCTHEAFMHIPNHFIRRMCAYAPADLKSITLCKCLVCRSMFFGHTMSERASERCCCCMHQSFRSHCLWRVYCLYYRCNTRFSTNDDNSPATCAHLRRLE